MNAPLPGAITSPDKLNPITILFAHEMVNPSVRSVVVIFTISPTSAEEVNANWKPATASSFSILKDKLPVSPTSIDRLSILSTTSEVGPSS